MAELFRKIWLWLIRYEPPQPERKARRKGITARQALGSLDHINKALARKLDGKHENNALLLNKYERQTLKTLGPYVELNPDVDGHYCHKYHYASLGWPAMAFYGINRGWCERQDDKADAEFIHLIKLAESPIYCELVDTTQEIIYQAGLGYDMRNGKSLWIKSCFAINKSTQAIRELIHTEVRRTKFGIQRHRYKPLLDLMKSDAREDEYEQMIRLDIFWALNASALRDSHWQAICTHQKNGNRITFGIEAGDAKYVFRERLYSTDGKTKIIHWVKAHVRHTDKGDQNITTHIRGSREFVWDDWDVKILMPRAPISGLTFHCYDERITGWPKLWARLYFGRTPPQGIKKDSGITGEAAWGQINRTLEALGLQNVSKRR